MDEKTRKTLISRDLTSLNDLEPTAAPKGAEKEPTFNISPESDALPALEGLDDLLSPMSPTSPGLSGSSSSATFTAFDGLPPIDPEIQSLAESEFFSEESTRSSITRAPETILEDPIVAGPTDAVTDGVPSAIATPMGASLAASLEDPRAELAGSKNSTQHYSDHVAASSAPTLATNPYSLLIEGHLRVHEREALIQILTRENLGVREVELEPQFVAGRILIPRVSEYAGVQIVQTLRNSNAKMRLGPSDRIYSSRDSHDEDPLIYPPNPDSEVLLTEEVNHRADSIILTSDPTVPGKQILQALDVLHGSINLKAAHVGQPQSPVFQDAIERLKRQLKFQAHHRGANALLSFHYELHPLEGQTVYKLVVQARAVRVEV